jgi:hypothetical protein
MSTNMARQGGQVQQEQSNMCLAMNIAKMGPQVFLPAAIDKTQYLIKKMFAQVQDETKRSVEFPGHYNLKAVIQRKLAILRQNQTARCLPCQNGILNDLQIS